MRPLEGARTADIRQKLGPDVCRMSAVCLPDLGAMCPDVGADVCVVMSEPLTVFLSEVMWVQLSELLSVLLWELMWSFCRCCCGSF